LLIMAAVCVGCCFVLQRARINLMLCSNSGLIAIRNASAIADVHGFYALPNFLFEQMALMPAGAKHAGQG